MTFWYNKLNNGVKQYCSKSISINWYPKHWKKINYYTNGATKKDNCFDASLWVLGFCFRYTDWDYKDKNLNYCYKTNKPCDCQGLCKDA